MLARAINSCLYDHHYFLILEDILTPKETLYPVADASVPSPGPWGPVCLLCVDGLLWALLHTDPSVGGPCASALAQYHILKARPWCPCHTLLPRAGQESMVCAHGAHPCIRCWARNGSTLRLPRASVYKCLSEHLSSSFGSVPGHKVDLPCVLPRVL